MEFGNTRLEVPKDDELQHFHDLFHDDLSPKKNHQDLYSRNKPENFMFD